MKIPGPMLSHFFCQKAVKQDDFPFGIGNTSTIRARRHLNRAETFLLCTSFSMPIAIWKFRVVAFGESICLPNSSHTGKYKLFLSKPYARHAHIYIRYTLSIDTAGMNISYSSQKIHTSDQRYLNSFQSTLRPA